MYVIKRTDQGGGYVTRAGSPMRLSLTCTNCCDKVA